MTPAAPPAPAEWSPAASHPAPPAPPLPQTPAEGAERALRVAVVVAIAVLSFLPIAGWIPGGYDEADFALQVDEWVSGSAIALGLGFILALFSLRRTALWHPLDSARLDARVDRAWWRWSLGLTGIALVVYAWLARFLFNGLPQQIDEFTQTIHARIYAGGRLWAPIPDPMEFFATQHMLYVDGKMFSQFPPGGPAALALFMQLDAAWLTGPAFAAGSVAAFAWYLRRSGERPAVALLALALFAFAPFGMFMSGSRMNHVMTTTFTLLASAALVATARSPRPRPALALLCGLGYGLAATFRPVDAAAFAVPGAVWLIVLALGDRRRIPDLLLSGIGVALPIGTFLWINAQTTGHPTLFGYQLLWGKGHDIGFHVAPWGLAHTPAIGFELLHLYFSRLQRLLFETPIPSLLPALLAIGAARRLRAEDRYLLAGSLLVVLSYWAYWHNGNFLGPRFLFPLVPVLALWTARFPALLRDRLAPRDGVATTGPRPLAYRTAVFALLVGSALAILYSIPLRAAQYRATFAGGHWDPPAAAAAAGIRNAVILVREGWESSLVVRMWRFGISHPRSELYYRAIDACRLEHTLSTLEQAGADSAGAVRRLDGLLADSLRVTTASLPSGASIRVQADYPYSAYCRARLTENVAGVLALAPNLAAKPDGNVWARDLHARDTLLLARHPSRPVYLLRPESPERDSRPVFVRVDLDSARRDWARAPR